MLLNSGGRVIHMKNKHSFSQGYSLIELLFVIVIFSVIGLAIIQISNFSWNSYTYNKKYSIVQRNRTAIQQLAKHIRNASNIDIHNSEQQIILKGSAANHQFKYYHYILQDNNLYLHTTNYKPTFINDKDKLNDNYKLIIDQQIISNQQLFSKTKNNLIDLAITFNEKVKQTNNKNKRKFYQTINKKIYPRNENINITFKSQSEVKK